MIVLLHGLLGAPASFDAFIEALPSGTGVHRPCLPGHGGRVAPAAGFELAVDELARTLGDELGSTPVDVIGYSLGARLALGLCARHPQRIRRALLVSVHPGLVSEDERRARRAEDERWARLAEREGMGALVDAWERHPVFATQATLAPALLAGQRAIRLAHDPAYMAAAIRALGLGTMPSYRDVLDALRGRLTLIAGARDAKFAALAQARRAPVELIPAVGHNPLIEAPRALAAIATRVLKEASP